MPLICPLPYMILSGPDGVRPGWRLYTYAAGTTNAKTTFTAANGSTPNANPVVSDSQGRMAVWLTEGDAYRLVLHDENDATVWEADDVVGVGSGDGGSGGPGGDGSEWLQQPDVPEFIDSATYRINGDQTFEYHIGRRQRIQVAGGLSYSTISSAEFAAGDTTIVCSIDNGTPQIDSGISIVSLGINTAADGRRSIHRRAVQALGTASEEDVGTAIGDVVQLEDVGGSAGLPAVDGSQLTGITAPTPIIPGLEYLASVTAANSVSLSFGTATWFDPPYIGCMFVLDGLVPRTGGDSLYMQADLGGGYLGGTDYATTHWGALNGVPSTDGDDTISRWDLAFDVDDVVAGNGASGLAWVHDIRGRVFVTGQTSWRSQQAIKVAGSSFSGYLNSSGDLQGIRFRYSTGNIDSGAVHMYGIRNA